MTGSRIVEEHTAAERPAIELVVGDLLEQEVDAIVVPFAEGNGAASRVQLALRRAAGPALADELARRLATYPDHQLPAGRCVVTPAFSLPARSVVHVRLAQATDEHGSRALLARAMEEAMATCRSLGAKTVALPAIGTGSFGYRTSLVARVTVEIARRSQRTYLAPPRIRFVLAGPATLETFLHAVSDAAAVRSSA